MSKIRLLFPTYNETLVCALSYFFYFTVLLAMLSNNLIPTTGFKIALVYGYIFLKFIWLMRRVMKIDRHAEELRRLTLCAQKDEFIREVKPLNGSPDILQVIKISPIQRKNRQPENIRYFTRLLGGYQMELCSVEVCSLSYMNARQTKTPLKIGANLLNKYLNEVYGLHLTSIPPFDKFRITETTYQGSVFFYGHTSELGTDVEAISTSQNSLIRGVSGQTLKPHLLAFTLISFTIAHFILFALIVIG